MPSEQIPLRLVLLTRSGPEHLYVANRLAAAFRLEAILEDTGAQISSGQRFVHAVRAHTTGQLVSRSLLKLWTLLTRDSVRRRRRIEEVLGEDARSHRFQRLVLPVPGLNSTATIATLRALSPHLLLIYGTGIAGQKILRTASKLALNLHTGISPDYRGAQCAFWPLYRGELDMIGATVHVCTEEIDGGPILARATARLEEDDDVHAVFARAVAAGAEIYPQAIRKAAAGCEGEAQDLSIGTEYRSAMKGLWEEWAVRRRIRSGLIRDHVRSRAKK